MDIYLIENYRIKFLSDYIFYYRFWYKKEYNNRIFLQKLFYLQWKFLLEIIFLVILDNKKYQEK